MSSASRNTYLLLVCASLFAAPPAGIAQSPAGSGTDGNSEAKAMALLAKVETAMLRLKTYQAECASTLSYPPRNGKPAREVRGFARLLAAKPNKMRYDEWHLKPTGRSGQWARDTAHQGITFVCDGSTNWKQFGARFRTDKFTRPEQLGTILEPWNGFYAAQSSPRHEIEFARKRHELLELRPAGREVVEGMACDKVFAHVKTRYEGEAQEYWTTWYIGGDGLVRRKVERIEFGGKPGYTRDAVIRHIRTDAPIAANVFTYTPPQGVVSAKEAEQRRPALLANGSPAPNFIAYDLRHKPVKLSDFRGKVVVLDFWASWCGPCVASMPHNQEVAKKLQAQGLPVVLLAVDNSEEQAAFAAWVKAKSASLPSLTFAHVPPKTNVSHRLFHVSGIPTQYVLDRNGIVRASSVGYGGPTNALENSIRAALAAPAGRSR